MRLHLLWQVRKGVKEFDAEEVVQDLEAQGGYTDVGLHTGTQPRNTAWPLIQAVFKVGLQGHKCQMSVTYVCCI